MSIGVILTDEDLQAIKRLYNVRWGGNILNWNVRDSDYCMWIVSCPDKRNQILIETGQSLAKTIDILLERVLK